MVVSVADNRFAADLDRGDSLMCLDFHFSNDSLPIILFAVGFVNDCTFYLAWFFCFFVFPFLI